MSFTMYKITNRLLRFQERSWNYSGQMVPPCRGEQRRPSLKRGEMGSFSYPMNPTLAKRVFSENKERDRCHETMDEKEWNKRMKTWEMKKEQLASGRKFSSQGIWKELPLLDVTYKTPLKNRNRQCKCVGVETEGTASRPDWNSSSIVHSIVPNEHEENNIENEKTPEQNRDANEEHAENGGYASQPNENTTNDMIPIISSVERKENFKNEETEENNEDDNKEHTEKKERQRKDSDGKQEINEECSQIKSNCQDNPVERKTIQETTSVNEDTGSEHIKNERTSGEHEEIERVHSSVVTLPGQVNHSESVALPIKLNSSEERQRNQTVGQSRKKSIKKIDSKEVDNNSKKRSSQGKVEKKQEITSSSSKGELLSGNLEFSKSVLSPIQSVSDNNYPSDGATESNSQLKTMSTKQPNGDADNVHPVNSIHDQKENSLEEEKEHVKDGQHEAALDSSIPGTLQTKEIAEDCQMSELVQLESVTEKKSHASSPKVSKKDDNTELKSSSQVPGESTSSKLAAYHEPNFKKLEENDSTNGNSQKVVGELKQKSSSTYRKSKDISVILDELLTVTKALKEEHSSKDFNKNHGKSRACDSQNDRALNAIVCCPEASSIDDYSTLPGHPLFMESSLTRERIMNPLVVECVTTKPAEFYKITRETNDRFLISSKDDGQKTATRIEWYEDLYNAQISSEELDTHQDAELRSYKEVIVDRRGCRSKNEASSDFGYERRNSRVRRFQIHHDSSSCYLNQMKRENNELSPSY